MPPTESSELANALSELESEAAIQLTFVYDIQSKETIHLYSDHSLSEQQREGIIELANVQIYNSAGMTATMITHNEKNIIILGQKENISAVIIADSASIKPALARSHLLQIIDDVVKQETPRSEQQHSNGKPIKAVEANSQRNGKTRPHKHPLPKTRPSKSDNKHTRPISLPTF